MIDIGERLRHIREEKSLSQGDVEKRTGLLRCYTSRVENGHTVPSVETLEKYARAFEVPLHMLFYEGKGTPKPPKLLPQVMAAEAAKEDPFTHKLRRLVGRMDERNRRLFLQLTQKTARR